MVIKIKCLSCGDSFYGSRLFNYIRCPLCYNLSGFHFIKKIK